MFQLFIDQYERKARVTPGLIVALPIVVPLVLIYGPQNPVLTSLLSVLGGSGALYALANIVRGRGKTLEGALAKEWGGMPTTIALRHRDSFLDSTSKLNYHRLITEKLGIDLPTEKEEAAAPIQADDTYVGAARRLRERTRTNRELLLKENIAYGFHRNMLAMKSVGIFTCLIGIIWALLLGRVLRFDEPYFVAANLLRPGLAYGLTLSLSVILLSAWVFYFNRDAVKRVGFAYAERLFECLHSLPSA